MTIEQQPFSSLDKKENILSPSTLVEKPSSKEKRQQFGSNILMRDKFGKLLIRQVEEQ